MKFVDTMKNLPAKVKKQLQTAMLLLCAIATFAVPAFGGGYNILKDTPVVSSAAAIEDVDLPVVAASAFCEARKVMNATDADAKETFINNTTAIAGSKWQNIGLLIGSKDVLSGSVWGIYQNPSTLSASEVATYGSSGLIDSYNKYKAFGYAVQNLNNSAQKSNTTSVSVEEGLDAMSEGAIKLGGLGVKFLNDYNPGPVLISLYDSKYLNDYRSNKLVKIVNNNDVLRNIVKLFGDKVPGTGLSFFLILNGVIAVIGLAFSMLLTLLGNQSIGDGIRKFLIKIAIGTVGIFVISNILCMALGWVNDTVLNMTSSTSSSYVEENLNMYDWYLTGFQIPAGTTVQIDSTGNFVFTRDNIRAINQYTYHRLVGGDGSDEAIRERMETYTQNGNWGTASFVTPSTTSADGGEAWATDVYYALMKNYAENKDLLDGNDDESSPLYGKTSFSIVMSRYLWMSYLNMVPNGGGWNVSGTSGTAYYGLNPISALNLVRTDFSGEAITGIQTVYPRIAYVAFDAVNSFESSAPSHMNSLIRFIACFTLVLAALKGLVTIFTAGFAGLISGGVKTAFGSAGGLGQAIGAVVALIFGIVGISVIMSMTMSLLDVVYGMAMELVGDVEVINSFIQPLTEWLGKVPVIGSLLANIASSAAGGIMTLILALTFPKLGGIPITVFAQYMSDLPGRIAEQAQRIEGMLLSGRSSAGGFGGGGPRGQYGRQAQAMAGQAFSGSTRQAAAIVKSGAMAAGSLAGAGLSMAGKAINKKGDAIEGRPSNPGIDGWDNMSPEEQARAAEVAANTAGWEDMDQDARQRAMEEAGVFGGGTADEGSTNGRIEDAPETQDGADSIAGEAAEPAPVEEAVPTEQSIGEAGAPIQTADQKDSIGGPVAADEAPVEDVSGSSETASTIEGASGSSTNDSKEKAGAGDKTLNVKEGDKLQSGNQQITANNKQDSNVNATTIDQSNQLGGIGASGDGRTVDAGKQGTQGLNTGLGAGKTGESSKNTDVQTATAQAAAAAGAGRAGSGVLPAGGGQRNTSGTQQAPSASQYTSVNNVSNADGNSEMKASAQINANNQLKTGDHQSVAGENGMDTTGSLDSGTNKQSEKAADKGASSESMSGTAKSKWGKEMTLKEQKTARALHAVGDALQMAGGNRTLGDGLKDAVGYAGEAAASSVLPPELMSGFAQDLRNRRQLRSELARNNRQNNNKKS